MKEFKIKCMTEKHFNELVEFLAKAEPNAAVMVLVLNKDNTTSIQLGFNGEGYILAKEHIEAKLEDLEQKSVEQLFKGLFNGPKQTH